MLREGTPRDVYFTPDRQNAFDVQGPVGKTLRNLIVAARSLPNSPQPHEAVSVVASSLHVPQEFIDLNAIDMFDPFQPSLIESKQSDGIPFPNSSLLATLNAEGAFWLRNDQTDTQVPVKVRIDYIAKIVVIELKHRDYGYPVDFYPGFNKTLVMHKLVSDCAQAVLTAYDKQYPGRKEIIGNLLRDHSPIFSKINPLNLKHNKVNWENLFLKKTPASEFPIKDWRRRLTDPEIDALFRKLNMQNPPGSSTDSEDPST